MSELSMNDTIAPTSDQLDAVDLLAGHRVFTIEKVTITNAEQPVNIKLAEFPRPWRPGKSMRRVLVAIWGGDAATYVGRRLELWCDPTVRFGGAEVGGVRITRMSNIDKARTVPLLVTRGKSAMYKVTPLGEATVASPAVQAELRIDAAVAGFAKGSVTLRQLERRVGRARGEWTPEDVDALEALFGQLTRREIAKDEAFPAPEIDPTVTDEMPDGGVQ